MKSKNEDVAIEAPPTLPEPGFVRTDMGRPKVKKVVETAKKIDKEVKKTVSTINKEMSNKKEKASVEMLVGATTNGKFKFNKSQFTNTREAVIAIKQIIDDLHEKGLREIILSFKK